MMALTTTRNQKLERAYRAKKTIVTINDKYKADISNMFQYRIKDTNKQRKIKREEVSEESDEDQPPKKKVKLDTTAITGHKVTPCFAFC